MNPRFDKQGNKDPFIHSFTSNPPHFVLFDHLTVFPVTVYILLFVSPLLSHLAIILASDYTHHLYFPLPAQLQPQRRFILKI